MIINSAPLIPKSCAWFLHHFMQLQARGYTESVAVGAFWEVGPENYTDTLKGHQGGWDRGSTLDPVKRETSRFFWKVKVSEVNVITIGQRMTRVDCGRVPKVLGLVLLVVFVGGEDCDLGLWWCVPQRAFLSYLALQQLVGYEYGEGCDYDNPLRPWQLWWP